VQDVTVPAERWTQERRRQHTRDLLLDAAEEVFAKRGFEGASLEEIAETAGYTRGAIYKHFGSKEELFLEANTRFNERYVQAFTDVLDPGTAIEEWDLPTIARRWREMSVADADRLALGAEFNLYVLRHPEVRPLVAEQQRALVEMVASFMEQQAARLGTTMRFPALTLARVALAASDGINLAGYLQGADAQDVFETFLQLLVSGWESSA
jgi:AcrR family transcriptional regulator